MGLKFLTQLFKRWISLCVLWIIQLVSLILILWITVYYPSVDSAIPRLIKGSLQMYSESY